METKNPSEITPGDLLAMIDVLDALIEQSDQLSADQAAALKDTAEALARKATAVSGMLKARLIETLEGQPRTIGETTYVPKKDGKWRPEHGKIQRKLADMAVIDLETGEYIEDSRDAALQAVRLTYELFVSPADMPKATGLKKLRLDKEDVSTWEHTGTKLVEVRDEDHG